jgi:hypothetical protein
LTIKIDVTVDDPKVIYPTLKADVENGTYFKPETGISGRVFPLAVRHAFPGAEVITFVLEFATEVSAGLIAHWLYDRLGNKGATIVIGKEEIRIENAEKLKDTIVKAIIKAGTRK